MKLIPADAPLKLWPLGTAGRIGDYIIAGAPFSQWQQASWAGIAGEAGQLENAWVDPDDASLLAEAAGPARLIDAGGELLAWTGTGRDGAAVRASASSFLIRYPWELLRLNEILVGRIAADDIRGELSPHAHVVGVLVLGEGSRVLPGVYIEGKVVIGRDCKVGPNCYLRGNTSIGDGCHIGQAVEIKNCLIGGKTNVGHLSYIGDSVLGDGVNLGAGTITSNLRHDGGNHRTLVDGEIVDTGRRKLGTIIGDGAHTGIHTAIYPGRKLGPAATTRPGAVVSGDIS
jgi:acetyltransferase-like isoleucine patch superfamily enzyme